MAALNGKIRLLKNMRKDLFQNLKSNLLALKVYVLDHIAEEVSRFGALDVLEVFQFEHLHYIVMKILRMTSMRRSNTLEEAVMSWNMSDRS